MMESMLKGAFPVSMGFLTTDREVLVGLVDADATSFRRDSGGWRPQKTLIELLAS